MENATPNIKQIATEVCMYMMERDIDPIAAAASLSFALSVISYQMGIPREALKERLCADVDHIFDHQEGKKYND